MKRFTETTKWEDPWFRKLKPKFKAFFLYLCDKCDGAGVWVVDMELAAGFVGEKIEPAEALKAFDGRLVEFKPGKWWMPKFIQFQYGRLSRDCKPHIPVFALLARHGISLDEVEQTKVGAGKNGVPYYIRKKVIERDGLICAYTGESIPEEDVRIDHVLPSSKGGTDSMLNLVVSCDWANSLKSDKHLDEFIEEAGLVSQEVHQRLIKRIGEGYRKAIHSLQEKEKDKDKEKEQEKDGESEGEKALRIYDQYPRHLNRPEALRAITKAMKTVGPDYLLARTAEFAKRTEGCDTTFIPYPASWFNAGGYDSDPSEWDRIGRKNGQLQLKPNYERAEREGIF